MLLYVRNVGAHCCRPVVGRLLHNDFEASSRVAQASRGQLLKACLHLSPLITSLRQTSAPEADVNEPERCNTCHVNSLWHAGAGAIAHAGVVNVATRAAIAAGRDDAIGAAADAVHIQLHTVAATHAAACSTDRLSRVVFATRCHANMALAKSPTFQAVVVMTTVASMMSTQSALALKSWSAAHHPGSLQRSILLHQSKPAAVMCLLAACSTALQH